MIPVRVTRKWNAKAVELLRSRVIDKVVPGLCAMKRPGGVANLLIVCPSKARGHDIPVTPRLGQIGSAMEHVDAVGKERSGICCR